jgi:uncharacterized protein
MEEYTMKGCLITLALVLATACTTLGQQAAGDASASREDILKLFDVMHVREQMKQVMDQVLKQMRSMSHDQMKKRDSKLTDEQIAQIDATSGQFLKDMPIDGMLDDMIPVYQKHLTKTDVDAMIGFYSTPTGQKILGEMPAITGEGMQAMHPRLRKMIDEASARMDRMAKEGPEKQDSKPSADTKKQ